MLFQRRFDWRFIWWCLGFVVLGRLADFDGCLVGVDWGVSLFDVLL